MLVECLDCSSSNLCNLDIRIILPLPFCQVALHELSVPPRAWSPGKCLSQNILEVQEQVRRWHGPAVHTGTRSLAPDYILLVPSPGMYWLLLL